MLPQCFLIVVLVFSALPFSVGGQEINYRRIRSFGNVAGLGYDPHASIIQGSDGYLYGTVFGVTRYAKVYLGGVFRIKRDGTGYRLIHNFAEEAGEANSLPSALFEDAQGVLYGTTSAQGTGGTGDKGTIFRLKRDGTSFAVLHSFAGDGATGASPEAGVTEGADGALYGTAAGGGSHNVGVIFRVSKDGSGFTVLHNFDGSDGRSPASRLIQGADGRLYGTAMQGGSHLCGTIFCLTTNGADFSILHHFGDSDPDGRGPLDVIFGGDGALYGMAKGGRYSSGMIFKVKPNGDDYRALHDFIDASDGSFPFAGLTLGSDQALYGTMYEGGTFGMGTVFKIQQDGSGFVNLHSFDESSGEGDCPYAGIIEGSDGLLYGATSEGGTSSDGGTVFKIGKDGSNYRTIWNFGFGGGDGIEPYAGILHATDGRLYGVTSGGGSNTDAGAIFTLNRDGSEYKLLRSFTGRSDGANLQAGLCEGSDGLLYGATQAGGENDAGLLFRLRKDGSAYSVLHRFGVTPEDGRAPSGTLVEGSDGRIYGLLLSDALSNGAVFRVNKDGSGYTVLYHFIDADGRRPQGGLIFANNGFLYGTTSSGGSGQAGTLFRLAADGSSYAVLHTFSAGTNDGGYPTSSLVEGTDGILYGTTRHTAADVFGTIFKLSPDGSNYQVIHLFLAGLGESYGPAGGLVEAGDGKLYGTAAGLYLESGVVFRLDKDGSAFEVLHHFTTLPADGLFPYAPLAKGADGAFYGTTTGGGDIGLGTVFTFSFAPALVTITGVELSETGALLKCTGGAAGRAYTIEGTEAVRGPWQTIGTNSASVDGRLQFIDGRATNRPVRFYRTFGP